jgi:hypothetical protein
MRIALPFLLALLLVPAAASAADPIPTPKPVFFASGSSRGTVGGHLQRGEHDLYSLKAFSGQVMTVNVTAPDDNIAFEIYEPGTTFSRDANGDLVFSGKSLHAPAEGEDTTRFKGRLPSRGTYIIAIASTRGGARYSMDIRLD